MSNASSRDFYETLGVPKEASKDDIKGAYRKLALQFHPDRNKDPGAEERFKQISEAYAILSDDDKRKQYDTYGKEGVYQRYGSEEDIFRGTDFSDVFRGTGFGGFDDIFGQLFGGGRRGPQRGNDISLRIPLRLEDVVNDAPREVEIPRSEQCPTCNGSGATPGTTARTCPQCGGAGQVQKVQNAGFARFIRVETCNRCGGQGSVIDKPCNECKGRGLIRRTRKISIKIPAGVDDGHTLRLRGEGEAGAHGMPRGDLYVVVSISEHPVFKRRDSDIYVETQVNAVEAMLGAEVRVPTLYGDVQLNIPAGTQPGATFKVKGKGLPRLSRFGKGDEYVIANIYVPKSLNGKQKDALRGLLKDGNLQ
ncbi:MAG: molecular chaperone DnaJ [Thaumarchaeota archaeon]|nr:molecular chaperone DnaJ [Nitrososphaerota archaeon]